MDRRAAIAGVFLAFALFLIYIFFFQTERDLPSYEVEDLALVTNVERLGVNLGNWNSWGAQQYSQNVLMNPGFEGVLERDLVLVARVEGEEVFLKDVIELPNFWEGGTVERLSSNPFKANVKEQKKESLVLDQESSEIEPGDLLVLTKEWSGERVAKWWVPDRSKGFVQSSSISRPESPGRQSVQLKLTHETRPQINYYLDTLSEKAGKMLPIEGQWRLSFWAKAGGEKEKLRVSFRRIGRWDRKPTVFIDRLLSIGTDWQQINLEFLGIDQGSVGPLQLKFEAVGDAGDVWIDDAFLGKEQPTGLFREEMVKTLKKMRPGFLRTSQRDAAESLANLMRDSFGRTACRFHPCPGSREISYHYGLRPFLSLSKEVGAKPWIELPALLTDQEVKELLQEIDGEAMIEIDLHNFAPYEEAGQRRIRELSKLVKEVSGQRITVLTNLTDSSVGDGQAAPLYLVEELPTKLNPEETLKTLFSKKRETPEVKELYISKINFATLKGEASSFERNRLVTSAAAGLSLGHQLTQLLQSGVKAVGAYKLAGYEIVVTEPKEKLPRGMDLKLFGLVRDLSETGRFRPTGLAVAMINRVVGGDLHLVKTDNENLIICCFIEGSKHSYLISSTDPKELEITLSPPAKQSFKSKKRYLLSYSDLFESNEEEKRVRIKNDDVDEMGGLYRVKIPAFGLVVLSDV